MSRKTNIDGKEVEVYTIQQCPFYAKDSRIDCRYPIDGYATSNKGVCKTPQGGSGCPLPKEK